MMTFVVVQGSIMALMTAYRHAKNDRFVRECVMYFLSILQGYILLIVFLPNMYAFKSLTISCIILVCIPMVKLCWKFIICSILKFHFDAFTWDHVLPTVSIVSAFIIEALFKDSQSLFGPIISCMIVLLSYTVLLLHTSAWAYGTVNQMARHLGINVFTITRKSYEQVLQHDNPQ